MSSVPATIMGDILTNQLRKGFTCTTFFSYFFLQYLHQVLVYSFQFVLYFFCTVLESDKLCLLTGKRLEVFQLMKNLKLDKFNGIYALLKVAILVACIIFFKSSIWD